VNIFKNLSIEELYYYVEIENLQLFKFLSKVENKKDLLLHLHNNDVSIMILCRMRLGLPVVF
jgi:hypothetical protein